MTRLAELVRQTSTVEVEKHDRDHAFVREELLPQLVDLLGSAIAMLGDLEHRAAALADSSAQQASELCPRALGSLSDLTFVTSAELNASARQLQKLRSSDEAFGLMVAAERAKARLIRGLGAVEVELAAVLGHPSAIGDFDPCEDSLRLRSLVTKFRRRMTASANHDLELALRSLAASLAWLLGRDDFQHLRVSDRLTARSLQERTLAWFRSPQRCEEDGRRIWQEAATFEALLKLINNRPELVEHDRAVVVEVIGALSQASPHGVLPSAVVERLYAIHGRDDRFDQLVVQGADAASLLTRLLALLELLQHKHGSFGQRSLAARDKESGAQAPTHRHAVSSKKRLPVAAGFSASDRSLSSLKGTSP